MRKAYYKNKGRFDAPYPKRFLGVDGNWYRSVAERDISFFFKEFGIQYQTEASIFKGANRKFQYDWKITFEKDGKKHAIYIEYFGYSGKDYYQRRKEKIKFYKKKGLTLISLVPMDLENLAVSLRKKLRPYWKYIVGRDYQIRKKYTLEEILELLPDMNDQDVEKIRNYSAKVLQSRNDFVPVTIHTIGKFNRKKKHNAFVSLVKYQNTSKSRNFAFKYIPIWNTCESKEVHIVHYAKEFDKKNPDLYQSTWKLMVKEGSILAIRNNAKFQNGTESKFKYYLVDSAEYYKSKNTFLREISAKRALDLTKMNTNLCVEV
jgi:hypothetical protein